MPAREFAEPLNEMEQIFRPRHQDHWPIWETREELKQPWVVGFPKIFVTGEWYRIMQNGGTAIAFANQLLETVITAFYEVNITKSVDKLESSVTVEVGTTTVTENQFAGGRLQVKSGTGVAYDFPIVGNTAGGGTALDTIQVYVTEMPIELDTTTDIQIITSPYRNIRVATASGERAVGACPTTIEADAYFWGKFRGDSIGQASGAMAASSAATIALAPGDEGTYITHTGGAGIQHVGVKMDPNAVVNNEYFALALNLP